MTILADQAVQHSPYQSSKNLQDRTRHSGSAGLSSVFRSQLNTLEKRRYMTAEVPLRIARLHLSLAGQTTTLVPSAPYSESAAESDFLERQFLVAFPSGIVVFFQLNDGEIHGFSGSGPPPAIV